MREKLLIKDFISDIRHISLLPLFILYGEKRYPVGADHKMTFCESAITQLVLNTFNADRVVAVKAVDAMVSIMMSDLICDRFSAWMS